jgi:hypothetical protein
MQASIMSDPSRCMSYLGSGVGDPMGRDRKIIMGVMAMDFTVDAAHMELDYYCD